MSTSNRVQEIQRVMDEFVRVFMAAAVREREVMDRFAKDVSKALKKAQL